MANRFHFTYWSIPFRGNFVRNLFAYTDTPYDETSTFDGVLERIKQPVSDQACPFMGPPLLLDLERNFTISQMSAIVLYLGETLELMPAELADKAVTIKILNDCTDLLSEITRSNGAHMWEQSSWDEFISGRFQRWLTIFEETGKKNGLSKDGFYFGSGKPGAADLTLHALFATMERCLPELSDLLRKHAPVVMNNCDRISKNPGIKKLTDRQIVTHGSLYCGGEIEKSIRHVISTGRGE